jgi:hypothetical protein
VEKPDAERAYVMVEVVAVGRTAERLKERWRFRRTAPAVYERRFTVAELDQFNAWAVDYHVAYTVQAPPPSRRARQEAEA